MFRNEFTQAITKDKSININDNKTDSYIVLIYLLRVGVGVSLALTHIHPTYLHPQVSIRTLKGFIFDPSTVTSSIVNDDDNEQRKYNAKEAMIQETKKNPHLLSCINNNKLKQLSLDQFIKSGN
jgi:hypothetical protein